MSGGHWDYIQYRFTDIAEDIEKLIEQNCKEKTEEELNDTAWRGGWYEKYPEDNFHTEYPEEVIEEFKKGLEIIKQAQVYIQRLVWLLSVDYGEENFLERLKDYLTKLNK